MLHKQDGTRAEWEYPFAVAGINISFMLAQMLDLQSGNMNFSNDDCTLLITHNRYTEKCSNCNECLTIKQLHPKTFSMAEHMVF